jgi:hypothetical protein
VLEAAVAYFHAAFNAVVQLEALLGDRLSIRMTFNRGVVMLACTRAFANGAVIEHGARCRDQRSGTKVDDDDDDDDDTDETDSIVIEAGRYGDAVVFTRWKRCGMQLQAVLTAEQVEMA